MRNQLLLALFFFTVTHTAQAQCDAKEYARIFSEAQSLQEQGQFIEAKNKYEAAKIYACGKKDEDAADYKIDALFEQIDLLRRQAYASDLAYKSKIALKDGDRNTAFRLAEFAEKFVDSNNVEVIDALLNALYYNDHPDTSRRLPRHKSLNTYASCFNVSFANDGEYILYSKVDTFEAFPFFNIIISDWKSKKKIRELKINQFKPFYIPRVAISPNGKWIALNYATEGAVEILELETGAKIRSFGEDNEQIIELAFSRDNVFLIVAFENGIVKVWNIETNQLVYKEPGIEDDSYPFALGGDRLAMFVNNKIKILNLVDFDSISFDLKDSSIGDNGITSIALSTNGALLAIGTGKGKVEVWDLSRNKLMWNLDASGTTLDMEVFKLVFKPKGTDLLITSGNLFGPNHSVGIWDTETGRLKTPLVGHMAFVFDASFSPDGRYISTCSIDGIIKVWDIKPGGALQEVTRFEVFGQLKPLPKPYCDRMKMNCVAAIKEPNEIQILALESNEVLNKIRTVARCVGIQFSLDGKWLALSLNNNSVSIWDLETNVEQQIVSFVNTTGNNVSFTNDGNYLCVAAPDSTLRIIERKTGNITRILPKFQDVINTVRYLPNNDLILIQTGAKRIQIWNLLKNVEEFHIDESATILDCTVSLDGKLLALGLNNETAKIWDLSNRKLVYVLSGHNGYVASVDISPNGHYLVTGTSSDWFIYDSSFKIWDVFSGKLLITRSENLPRINCVKFTSDGSNLVGEIGDKVKAWAFSGKELIRRWNVTGFQSSLMSQQLQTYGLEKLLDQKSGNEQKLIASGELDQILSFANLAASQASSSNILSRVEPHYARADRLYAAALALQDEALIRMDYAKMLRRWAEVYQSDGLEAKAAELNAKADGLWQEKD